MTRINCIPPAELTDRHLLAEYRELPRVFRLARRCPDAPSEYVLGPGHVKFFYDKLLYIYNRAVEIYWECKKRNFRISYEPFSWINFKASSLWNDWVPTPEAMSLNRNRINKRLRP